MLIKNSLYRVKLYLIYIAYVNVRVKYLCKAK